MLTLEVRHRTCEDHPEEEAPLMVFERVEDDAAIYTCPACREKISILLLFSRD